jgi:hypothetical protein
MNGQPGPLPWFTVPAWKDCFDRSSRERLPDMVIDSTKSTTGQPAYPTADRLPEALVNIELRLEGCPGWSGPLL